MARHKAVGCSLRVSLGGRVELSKFRAYSKITVHRQHQEKGEEDNMKLYTICFSPTGGTKKAADIISRAWDKENGCQEACEKNVIDLSLTEEDYSKYCFTEEDVCLVAAPSFGGRVPAPVVERLKKMEGRGARAILMAVYGNRAFEDTLLELEDTLLEAGFSCVAAVAAVAEHSIMHQFGQGRPDEEDVKELAGFAEKIKQRLSEKESAQAGPETKKDRIRELPGNRPYREYNGVPFKPEGGNSCTRCGLCAKQCPADAIPLEDPSSVDKEKCISCMRCVSVCPRHARDLNKLVLFAASQKMKKACSDRKKNELFM